MPGENTVEVDETKIREELRAAGGGAPLEGEHIPAGEQGAGQAEPGPAAPPPAMDWSEVANGVVFLVDKLACPNWQLTTYEKGALATVTCKSLEIFFPEIHMDPRVQALTLLGLVVASIASKRYNAETGWVPMRAAPAAPAEPEAPAGDGERKAA